MNDHTLSSEQITAYTQFLRREERAAATVEKYSHDILAFAAWLEKRPVTKETVAQWKKQLLDDSLSHVTVNTKLSGSVIDRLKQEEKRDKIAKKRRRGPRQK